MDSIGKYFIVAAIGIVIAACLLIATNPNVLQILN